MQTVKQPYALVFGNEGSGLPPEFSALGQAVRIPHSDAIDSLNLAVAAAIGAYAFVHATGRKDRIPMKQEYQTIYDQLSACVRYLAKDAKLKTGATVVLGCSTSEVAGGVIGHNSVPELGGVLAAAFLDTCRDLGLNGAVQCCEHLNRALVMAQSTLDSLRLTQVSVRPVPTAGGSTGAAAYDWFAHPAMASEHTGGCRHRRWRYAGGHAHPPGGGAPADAGRTGRAGACGNGVFPFPADRRGEGAVP